jgi:hypothetical protein
MGENTIVNCSERRKECCFISIGSISLEGERKNEHLLIIKEKREREEN